MVRMQVLDAKYSLDPKCTKLVINSLMKEDRTIIFENYEQIKHIIQTKRTQQLETKQQ